MVVTKHAQTSADRGGNGKGKDICEGMVVVGVQDVLGQNSMARSDSNPASSELLLARCIASLYLAFVTGAAGLEQRMRDSVVPAVTTSRHSSTERLKPSNPRAREARLSFHQSRC